MEHREAIPNPYAAPQSLDWSSDVTPEPRMGVYHPRILPRDMVDVLLGLSIGLPGALLVYALPLWLIVVLRAPLVLMPIAVISIVVAAIAAVTAGIQHVTVTPQGITARRGILPAIEIPWRDVVTFRELSRGEAFRVACFAPHRCAPQSLTYRNHVRVSTRTTFLVFPPRDFDMFRVTIESLWTDSLPPGQSVPGIRPSDRGASETRENRGG
jgi:hypothetical protein